MNDVTTIAASARTPAQIDESLETWLARACGLRLVWQAKGAPGQGNWTAEATRSNPNTKLALDAVADKLKPASSDVLIDALMRMSLKVAKKEAVSPEAAEAQVAEYVAELMRYPADIALTVVGEWHRDNIFWPAWAELEERLDALFQRRRTVLPAIQAAKRFITPSVVKTDDDKAAVRAMCAATVGMLTKTTRAMQRRYYTVTQRDVRDRDPEARKRALDALPKSMES